MIKTLLLASLLFATPDWNRYDPEGKFAVGKYYQHPYNQIIYVREQQLLHDGSLVLIIEQVQGRTCKWPHKVCDMPANSVKGVWIEVDRID